MHKIIIAFSLTELMIVVAIAAFISAIAIPNYKVYINKATVSDMISVVEPCQTLVYQSFLQTATFPTTTACYGQTLTTTISIVPLKDGVNVAYSVAGDGSYAQFQIQSNIKTSAGSIANLYIRLGQSAATSVGGGDIVYTCGVLSGDANPIPSKYLPAGCSATISP